MYLKLTSKRHLSDVSRCSPDEMTFCRCTCDNNGTTQTVTWRDSATSTMRK